MARVHRSWSWLLAKDWVDPGKLVLMGRSLAGGLGQQVWAGAVFLWIAESLARRE
jgi:hypothetical protein